MCLCAPPGIRHLPRGEGAGAVVTYLALSYQGIKRFQCLVQRNRRVVAVHLVEIDVVGLKAAQTVLDGPADMAARQAPIVRSWSHRAVHLGRQHDVVPESKCLEGFTEN